jgi:hypothetical protein
MRTLKRSSMTSLRRVKLVVRAQFAGSRFWKKISIIIWIYVSIARLYSNWFERVIRTYLQKVAFHKGNLYFR